MQIQQLTGIGKRESNQDFICIDRLESGASFFLIADGMGGYEKGDEAARIVSENILTFLNNIEKVDEHNIQHAVQKANLAIRQFNTKNQIKSGSTVGGVIFDKNIAHLYWVGDVMIYQIRTDKLLVATESHTLRNSLKHSNNMSDMGLAERYKHIVTRSISGKPSESVIGYFSSQYTEEDMFIICSDGVHNTISIDRLMYMLGQENNLSLIEKLLKKESQDNYSLIIIEN